MTKAIRVHNKTCLFLWATKQLSSNIQMEQKERISSCNLVSAQNYWSLTFILIYLVQGGEKNVATQTQYDEAHQNLICCTENVNDCMFIAEIGEGLIC